MDCPYCNKSLDIVKTLRQDTGKYKLMIDTEIFAMNNAMINVSKIKELANVPSNYVIYKRNEAPKNDELLRDSDRIELSSATINFFHSSLPPSQLTGG